MNKNYKIITINGIRGIIAAVFSIMCLIAGFIISPGWVLMQLWNIIAEKYYISVQMNIYQGVLLWAVIALSLYALNNRRALIGFGAYPALSPEQIKNIARTSSLADAVLRDARASQKKQAENNAENSADSTKDDEVRGRQ